MMQIRGGMFCLDGHERKVIIINEKWKICNKFVVTSFSYWEPIITKLPSSPVIVLSIFFFFFPLIAKSINMNSPPHPFSLLSLSLFTISIFSPNKQTNYPIWIYQMLQLFFAVAFSAVPLTLYVPPIRSLNPFVETIEDLLRQTAFYSLRAYPRFRLAFSRIFSNLFRLSR